MTYITLEFFKVDTLDKKINKGMNNQLFCHGINDLQNQVPRRNIWARWAKWGCMTKSHCHVMAIVIRIFPNWLRNGVVSHLIQIFNTLTKQQSCKDSCKIKKKLQFLENLRFF